MELGTGRYRTVRYGKRPPTARASTVRTVRCAAASGTRKYGKAAVLYIVNGFTFVTSIAYCYSVTLSLFYGFVLVSFALDYSCELLADLSAFHVNLCASLRGQRQPHLVSTVLTHLVPSELTHVCGHADVSAFRAFRCCP